MHLTVVWNPVNITCIYKYVKSILEMAFLTLPALAVRCVTSSGRCTLDSVLP